MNHLDDRGELLRIDRPVDVVYEAGAIADLLVKNVKREWSSFNSDAQANIDKMLTYFRKKVRDMRHIYLKQINKLRMTDIDIINAKRL